MEQQMETFYGLIDAATGSLVRIRTEHHESEEYGSSNVPLFTADPMFPLYRVRSAAEAAYAAESDPYFESATEERPRHGDFSRDVSRLVPARVQTYTSATRDADGRLLSMESRTTAEVCPVLLPQLVKGYVGMSDLNKSSRLNLGFPDSPVSRVLAVPLADQAAYEALIGTDIRLEGRPAEAFRVVAVAADAKHAYALLEEPRYVATLILESAAADEPSSPAP
jgi:hypothetical protein